MHPPPTQTPTLNLNFQPPTKTAYDPVSAQHTLRYQDGDEGVLWVGAERIRFALSAGETLQPPTAEQLRRLAASYSRWSAAVAAWRQQQGNDDAAEGSGGEDESGRVISAPPGSDAWVSGWYGQCVCECVGGVLL